MGTVLYGAPPPRDLDGLSHFGGIDDVVVCPRCRGMKALAVCPDCAGAGTRTLPRIALAPDADTIRTAFIDVLESADPFGGAASDTCKWCHGTYEHADECEWNGYRKLMGLAPR